MLEVRKILDGLAQEAIRIVNSESGFAGLRTAKGMIVHKYFRLCVAIPFEHTWPLGQGIPGWFYVVQTPTADLNNGLHVNQPPADSQRHSTTISYTQQQEDYRSPNWRRL